MRSAKMMTLRALRRKLSLSWTSRHLSCSTLNGLLKVYQPIVNFFVGGRFFQGTKMVLAEVVSDAKDPRGYFRWIAQAVQILLDFYEGFLDEVIGD
jgi:hypothetical protein